MPVATEDSDLHRTRPMPVVDDAVSRSTDREAARARSATKARPADEPSASGYSSTGSGAATGAVVAESEPRVVVERRRPTTDRWHGAFALFVLRLVCAAIFGVRSWQHLINLGATREFFGRTMLPYPQWAALATGIGEALIALSLVIGLLVRVAGLGMMIITVGALVFVLWAPFHLFAQGAAGFVGEHELLLAAAGLLFLLLGGGGWGADRMFRSNKSKGLPDDDDDDF